MSRRPDLPIPDPLRGIEIPSFTHYSIVVRLPEIARRTLADNSFDERTVLEINALIAEIPNDRIRPVYIPLAPDEERWKEYVEPYLGMNWLEVPWFFAEEYFYERMLEATGYFQTGPGQGIDPFAKQKRLGLETTVGQTRTLCQHLTSILKQPKDHLPAALTRLIKVDLWGNQNDLSLWPVDEAAEEGENAALREAHENILVDDSSEAIRYITSLDPLNAQIDLLADNAGYELVTDLALVDVLLSCQLVSKVILNIKPQPVFVSDAMEKDVRETLDFLSEDSSPDSRDFAARLRQHIEQDRLQMRTSPYWVSPLPMWEMPPHLWQELQDSHLIISKGDANYRRLLGDRHWQTDLPFRAVINYLPAACLAIRTLKSEIVVGLDPARIPSTDPNWMSDGRWGLIQFAPSEGE